MRTLTNTSLYIIVLDYLMPLLGTFNSHTETMNGTVHRTVYFQNIFSRENRPLGLTGSTIHETRRKNGGLMRRRLHIKTDFLLLYSSIAILPFLNLTYPTLSKRNSTDLYVRQIPGSEVYFFNCLPLPNLYGSAWNIFICVIDQAWGQDGWILARFFWCVFMERDE